MLRNEYKPRTLRSGIIGGLIGGTLVLASDRYLPQVKFTELKTSLYEMIGKDTGSYKQQTPNLEKIAQTESN